jgi:hypothetical protein
MSDVVILLSSTVVLTASGQFFSCAAKHSVSNMSMMRPCSTTDRQSGPDLGWESSKNHGSIMKKKSLFRAS